MSRIIFIISILLQINILVILDENRFYTLSDNGEKGSALTSFTNNLILISSSKKYNIINKNYNLIQDNKNDAQGQNYFSNNFEIVESSINKVTNESIILIAESSTGNKINLYSFNISDSLEEGKNPKLIYSINTAVDNRKISFIKVGNDKYLLSYFLAGNKFENLFFKYSSYGGFEIIKKFVNIGTEYKYYISCFLLYEQFPVCYYSEKGRDALNNIICSQKIIALDIIFNNNDNRVSKTVFNSDYNDCFFTKAVYLSNDYAIFCYMDNNNHVYCDYAKLSINFVNFEISIETTPTPTHIFISDGWSLNLNKIDLI